MSGYFNDEFKEYVITDMRPRRPLENYLWNEDFLVNVNHFGFGESFLRLPGNDRRQLFTETEATRLVYIKDRDTNEFFDTNRNYQNKAFDEYKCFVGIGYQKIISEYKGIRTEFIITVPDKAKAELWQIRIKNTGDTKRKLSVVSYSRPDANVTQHWAYGHANFEDAFGGLYFCHDAFNVNHNYSGIYVKADIKPDSYDVTDINFKGYNEWGNPDGLYNDSLSNKGVSFDNHYCAALQFNIVLNAGEEKYINIVAGISTDLENAMALSDEYLKKGYFEKAIEAVKKEADQIDCVYTANTPDGYINSMVNVWLKRQISLGKTWGRVYSKGFRDIMQDVAAFVSFGVDTAKQKIMNCLEHQRTEEKVIKSINAAQDFGIDTLVLDDGWFGNRNSEFTSMGDWFVNKEKFPNGLENIIKLCKSKGFKFGLWFEPEVISPESELYKKHPDWCIHIDGIEPIQSRNELLLDFSREEVVNEVYEKISAILKKYDITYVKWDMNRNATDNGSSSLLSWRQGEYSHRYILGVYSLMQRFKNEFPHIFFEGSAGGGGRFDFGILYYMPQIWTSDNSDAIGRLQIQYGTSMVFPPETISAHVSDCPNHQTGRTTPFKTRGDVAQLFSLGYELDPKSLTAEVKELLIAQVIKHRELEAWIGDAEFYRLRDPSGCDNCAWQLVSADKKYAVVLYVTQLTKPKKTGEYLRLSGLDEKKKYNIQPLGIVASGNVLMYAGLPIKEQYKDFESIFFEISEVEQ